ncbi:DUF4267 domain-containing protein [Actinoallomurus sp. NPDC052308]|uniref:DUF4267 domain-containing protein n=1 Tax=Actinoallomurus sp. NPDC052308 TaxID=3155530 RepID=UPI0034331BBD
MSGSAGAVTEHSVRPRHQQEPGQHTVGWYMPVVAIMPLGDTLIVLRHGGTKAVAFGIHFATAVAMLISAALMFAV